jgi:hypothetical protein
MAYFSDEMMLPQPDRDTQPFWDGCNEHKLMIQRCGRCGTFRHFPRPVCHECSSFEWNWVESAGRGEVYTYIIVPHGVHPATLEAVPYNAAMVRLNDCGGVLLTTNIVNCANGDIQIGMPVQVVWEDAGDGVTLPRFEPV